jgi:hypothetical protein
MRESAMKVQPMGVIKSDEAYSKKMVLDRLGISQKFWDKMLDDGLPYTTVGHTRWVTGQALLEHLSKNAERKNHAQLTTE